MRLLWVIIIWFISLTVGILFIQITKKEEPKPPKKEKNGMEEDKFIKEEWFKDHKAKQTRTLDGIFDLIEWKKPQNNNYLITYVQMPGYLIVTGDIGDAIYAVRGFHSFKDWTKCDVHYFAGKCVASEYGRLYKEWDRDYLEKIIKEGLKERDKSWKEFSERGGVGALSSEQEWITWLSMSHWVTAEEAGTYFFGIDRYNWPVDGYRISIRCRAHLIGLKMAVEQLNL